MTNFIKITAVVVTALVLAGCAPGYSFSSSNSICLIGTMEGCPGFKP